MGLVNKESVADRLRHLIKNKFSGIDRRFAETANLTPSTLNGYTKAERIPTGENLMKLAKAGGVTADWILLGDQVEYKNSTDFYHVTETNAIYNKESFSKEEKAVISEYRAASDSGRETGRMVFKMNKRNVQNKKNAVSG